MCDRDCFLAYWRRLGTFLVVVWARGACRGFARVAFHAAILLAVARRWCVFCAMGLCESRSALWICLPLNPVGLGAFCRALKRRGPSLPLKVNGVASPCGMYRLPFRQSANSLTIRELGY